MTSLKFNNGTMQFHRGGSLVAESSFTWKDENTVFIEGLNLLCEVYRLDSETLMLIQKDTMENGHIDCSYWELKIQK